MFLNSQKKHSRHLSIKSSPTPFKLLMVSCLKRVFAFIQRCYFKRVGYLISSFFILNKYEYINWFIDTLILSTWNKKSLTNKQAFSWLNKIKATFLNKQIKYNCIWDRQLSNGLRRQTRALIEVLEETWFIKRTKKVFTWNWNLCWAFKLSKEFIELLQLLKDYNLKKQWVKTSNINDKIQQINALDILENCKKFGLKIKKQGWRYKIWNYIFNPRRAWNLLYDIIEEKSINLFNMLKKELNLGVYDLYAKFN